MRFMPMLKNKFPAELRATSSATTIDVLKVWVWGGVMNARSGVARGNGRDYFCALPARPFEFGDCPARIQGSPSGLPCLSYSKQVHHNSIRQGTGSADSNLLRSPLVGKEELILTFVVCSTVPVSFEGGVAIRNGLPDARSQESSQRIFRLSKLTPSFPLPRSNRPC